MEYVPKQYFLVLISLMCLTSFGLMLHASLTDAATMDELAHIPAGYGYVRHLDYRLNPEHPPLLKALAGIPLLILQPQFPIESPYWQEAVNGQWDMGRVLLYESGNDADTIVRLARTGPILLTIVLTILLYIWARELVGRSWALLPTFLFAFSPTVLAHGHYVTTDIAAAFGILLATYFFLTYLAKPSRRMLAFAGIAFGIAQLAKFSDVLLIPFFIILAILFPAVAVLARWRAGAGPLLRPLIIRVSSSLWSLALIGLIGYMIAVYPVYFLFTINYPVEKQAADTEFLLSSFADGPNAFNACFEKKENDGASTYQPVCNPMRGLADANIWMSKHYLTRPFAEYLLGLLMVVQRSSGGNTGYFLGEVSAAGWHHYFPVVYLLKEPLPVLLLILIAIIMSIRTIVRAAVKRRTRILDYLQTNFVEFAMLLFVVLYWTWSIKSPLNIGIRHLMPTLPFIYILTTCALKRWVAGLLVERPSSYFQLLHLRLRAIVGSLLKSAFVSILLLWFFLETVVAAPYFLSYFNELGGGTRQGYRYVTDSNYDWGQDLRRLQGWVNTHPEVDRVAIDYFGGGNPRYYLGEKAEGWWSSRGNPADQGIHWLAVSVNTLQGARGKTAPGFERNPEDEYQWLSVLRPTAPGFGNVPQPDFRAGTSIFIYKL